jgi:hypothetical protein
MAAVNLLQDCRASSATFRRDGLPINASGAEICCRSGPARTVNRGGSRRYRLFVGDFRFLVDYLDHSL